MRVALSTLGKFHTFDLARELHSRSALGAIFTAYPRFKLRDEALPADKIHTFPWIHTPYMAFTSRDRLGVRAVQAWEWFDRVTLDRHVASRLPDCDVFVGLSSSALKTGQVARSRGARYVCDRGSTHIRVQDQLLRDEHERWGCTYHPIDPRIIDREEAEYAEADCITVPSGFNVRSFVEQGVPEAKIKRLPYGVNLDRFSPSGEPDPTRFDVLFAGAMSLRKGVPYLLQAYQKVRHPRKSLNFAGAVSPGLIARMRELKLWPGDARLLGHLQQPELKHVMSRSHVMVLPSVEEGLAMVQAQAMACACPVIGTPNSGADDLFSDEQEGYIVPVRQVDKLAERLQTLADCPELRHSLGQRALKKVQQAQGWREYGDRAMTIYQGLNA